MVRCKKRNKAKDQATSSRSPDSSSDEPIDGSEDTIDPIGDTAASSDPAPSVNTQVGAPRRYRTVEAGSRLGRLELLQLIGEGGMATVFRARDEGLRREVAVKVLFPHLARKPEVVSRFHREGRAAAALDHPNILRVLDVGGGPSADVEDGVADPPYMVLELIDGGSLRELTGEEPLLAESVAAIGIVLCRALGVAHEAGIIHRDIKPANIMATVSASSGPRIVIADFGVAHVMEDDSVVTRTGALLGTPAYMSPEQATADDLDPRSDLYSVGATLYRLATGVMPFTGPTTRVVTSIMSGEFIPPLRRRPAIGPDLARVISKLMATRREDRYGDAGEAIAALTEVLEDSGVSLEEGIEAALKKEGESLETRVLEKTLERAEAAASSGKVPAAIALADRALALDSNNPRAMALIDSISSGRGTLRLALAGGAGLIAVAAISAFALGVFDSKKPAGGDTELATIADAAPDDAPTTAAIAPALDAAPLAMALDAAGPSTAIDAAPKRRPEKTDRVVRPAAIDAGPAKADASVAVAPRRRLDASVPEPPAPDGTVVITTTTWCQLTGAGPAIKVNRRHEVKLAPGSHRLRCVNEFTKLDLARSVTVRSGKTVGVSFEKKIRVTVNIGDGIELGGRFIRSGASFTTTPGRKAIVVRRGTERVNTRVTVAVDCVLGGKPLRCNPK